MAMGQQAFKARDEYALVATVYTCSRCGAQVTDCYSTRTGRAYRVNVDMSTRATRGKEDCVVVNRGDFHNCDPAVLAARAAERIAAQADAAVVVAAPAVPAIVESMRDADVKALLADSRPLREQALVWLLERQTADEQQVGVARWENGIGFSGVDAEILTSFAQQVNRKHERGMAYGTCLSDKQDAILAKKIVRYARQVRDHALAGVPEFA